MVNDNQYTKKYSIKLKSITLRMVKINQKGAFILKKHQKL